MPHPAATDPSPTGDRHAVGCRRPAGSGHRAAAGELAALAFQVPAPRPAAAPQIPRPRPAVD
ncbi:hypothetical protein H7X46_00790 [Pseudonocardia sp. C8]|uniref:hypothetical protein n=1 Tax=Pseudonocardia sp. C8 TaxID=2762759 RepID=UPI001642794C|nr:hypothetical protein [Pseudonocardia sp. C8]MBC3189603.1 hypothetical protein [Pseudonocardia sp. C8]